LSFFSKKVLPPFRLLVIGDWESNQADVVKQSSTRSSYDIPRVGVGELRISPLTLSLN
jgi:hypothetical protein